MLRQSKAGGSRIAAGIDIVAEDRATKLNQLPNQRVTLGGQELPTVRLVATPIMEDAGDLVFVLDVAN